MRELNREPTGTFGSGTELCNRYTKEIPTNWTHHSSGKTPPVNRTNWGGLITRNQQINNSVRNQIRKGVGMNIKQCKWPFWSYSRNFFFAPGKTLFLIQKTCFRGAKAHLWGIKVLFRRSKSAKIAQKCEKSVFVEVWSGFGGFEKVDQKMLKWPFLPFLSKTSFWRYTTPGPPEWKM